MSILAHPPTLSFNKNVYAISRSELVKVETLYREMMEEYGQYRAAMIAVDMRKLSKHDWQGHDVEKVLFWYDNMDICTDSFGVQVRMDVQLWAANCLSEKEERSKGKSRR